MSALTRAELEQAERDWTAVTITQAALLMALYEGRDTNALAVPITAWKRLAARKLAVHLVDDRGRGKGWELTERGETCARWASETGRWSG
jgi:hypothetical protein